MATAWRWYECLFCVCHVQCWTGMVRLAIWRTNPNLCCRALHNLTNLVSPFIRLYIYISLSLPPSLFWNGCWRIIARAARWRVFGVAKRLKRQMWWDDKKWLCYLLLVVGAIITIIVIVQTKKYRKNHPTTTTTQPATTIAPMLWKTHIKNPPITTTTQRATTIVPLWRNTERTIL